MIKSNNKYYKHFYHSPIMPCVKLAPHFEPGTSNRITKIATYLLEFAMEFLKFV